MKGHQSSKCNIYFGTLNVASRLWKHQQLYCLALTPVWSGNVLIRMRVANQIKLRQRHVGSSLYRRLLALRPRVDDVTRAVAVCVIEMSTQSVGIPKDFLCVHSQLCLRKETRTGHRPGRAYDAR